MLKLTMTMHTLDSMLKQAATADQWTHVIHRCAWCKRIVDEHGEYTNLVVLDETRTVVTDGMCPQCGAQALAQIAARRQALAA
jgi:hypothetical protein